MNDLAARAGRAFFGVALIGFAAVQFIYGDFVPGRAPAWPAGLPGQVAWVWISGALLIVAGGAIAAGWRARTPAIAVSVVIFVWALLRHVPLVIANPHGAVLTMAGKAVALTGGALAMAEQRFIRIGAACLGAFMILGGVQHFIYPSFVVMLVPEWIPARTFWVYFAGVALIAGGAGMQFSKTVRPAALALGLMLLMWVVLLHVPRAFAAAAAQQRNEWTAVFEALAFSGVALVVAGNRVVRPVDSAPRPA